MFSNCGLAVTLGDRLKTRQIKAIPLKNSPEFSEVKLTMASLLAPHFRKSVPV
jgi:hypothetical protein